jgi:hypothetical protein
MCMRSRDVRTSVSDWDSGQIRSTQLTLTCIRVAFGSVLRWGRVRGSLGVKGVYAGSAEVSSVIARFRQLHYPIGGKLYG